MTSIEIERRVSVEIPLVIGNTYLRHSVQLRVHSVVRSCVPPSRLKILSNIELIDFSGCSWKRSFTLGPTFPLSFHFSSTSTVQLPSTFLRNCSFASFRQTERIRLSTRATRLATRCTFKRVGTHVLACHSATGDKSSFH